MMIWKYSKDEIMNILQTKKIRLEKSSDDSAVYMAVLEGGEEKIIKNMFTEKKIEMMNSEIEICSKLKYIDEKFPCVVSHCCKAKGLYIEDYFNGVSYSKLKFTTDQKKKISKLLVNALKTMKKMEQMKVSSVNWRDDVLKEVTLLTYNLIDKNFIGQEHYSTFVWAQKTAEHIKNNCSLSLVHNDLHEENILFHIDEHKDITILIIDFEKAQWGDSLMDISKLIWTFRKDREYGNIFWGEYNNVMGKQNIEILKLYWCVDLMRHLSHYDELYRIDKWKELIKEEIILLKDIWRKEFILW